MKNELAIMVAQTCSGNTHEGNINTLESLARDASKAGCDMLCLPEVSGLVSQDSDMLQRVLTTDENDPYVQACQRLAEQYGLWIHNGSTPVMSTHPLPVNRTHLVNANGDIAATYDKIHLFDVHLADGRERLESKKYAPGNRLVLADTPWGPMGLTICYDLRFPQLYRDLAARGARLLFVPSAFNRSTGAAHWQPLLQARAIENGCFVLAAAQTGEHEDGRKTYGHSMVVHPWGNVLLDLGSEIKTAVLTIDLSASDAARQQIPSLKNARSYH